MALAELIKQGSGCVVDGVQAQITSNLMKGETRSQRPFWSFYVNDFEPAGNESSRVKVNLWDADQLPAGFPDTSFERGRLINFHGCRLSEFNKEKQISITSGSLCDGSIRLGDMKEMPPLRKRRREVDAPQELLPVERVKKPKVELPSTSWRRSGEIAADGTDVTFQIISTEWSTSGDCGIIWGLVPNPTSSGTCCIVFNKQTVNCEEFMLAANAWTTGTWASVSQSTLVPIGTRKSRCLLEFAVSGCKEIVQCDPQCGKKLPVRVFSFDIECISTRKSKWPVKQKDPIICISVVIQDVGMGPSRAIFYFGQCEDIDNAEVHCYDSEKDMLIGFQKCLLEADPDILTGYNILNFDIPWIFKRAELLGVDGFTELGRMKKEAVVIEPPEGVLPGKDVPYRLYNHINFSGRVVIDMLQMTREFLPERRLRGQGYKLGNVSSDILQCRKDDVPYAFLKPLHLGSNRDRKRIAVYCIKDSELVIDLMFHPRLNVVEKLVAKADKAGENLQEICYKQGAPVS